MDPDLFAVLDLASDAELDDLHDVLHGDFSCFLGGGQ